MIRKDCGLVLAGGGGRGAYQIGTLEALREVGLLDHVAAVAGTSVGALNAALFVSKTIEEAKNIWRNIKQSDLMDPKDLFSDKYRNSSTPQLQLALENFFAYAYNPLHRLGADKIVKRLVNIIRGEGLFSREGLRRLILENGICPKVRHSDIPVFACYKDKEGLIYKNMQEECYTDEDVVDTLFNSSAIPYIFRNKDMNGKYAVDGGFKGDNIPIKPIYDLGIRRIIVAGLNPSEELEKRSEFPDAKFVYIRPTKNIYLLASGKSVVGDGMVDFDGEHAEIRMKMGYNEARKQLDEQRKGRRHLPKVRTVSEKELDKIILHSSFGIADEKSRFEFFDFSSEDESRLRKKYDLYGHNYIAAFFENNHEEQGFVLTEKGFVTDDGVVEYGNMAAFMTEKSMGSDRKGTLYIFCTDGSRTEYSGRHCRKEALKRLLENIIDAI